MEAECCQATQSKEDTREPVPRDQQQDLAVSLAERRKRSHDRSSIDLHLAYPARRNGREPIDQGDTPTLTAPGVGEPHLRMDARH